MSFMLRRITLLLPFILLSGCTAQQNPFAAKPFQPTAVPADFAIVVDENHLSFVNRQHIQQVITAADGISRVTYTRFRDPDGAVTDRFTQESPLTPSQLQAMWNEVCQQNLLGHAASGVNWLSGADLYQENTNTIQIRADGRTSNYRRTNGFPASTRPLMLLAEAVRLPISQGANTPVVGAEPATAPALPAATAPATRP
jgi:hypothetical protein